MCGKRTPDEPCKRCQSRHQGLFDGEVCIHIPSPEKKVPAVFAFPELLICVDCGRVAGFEISNQELAQLRKSVQSAEIEVQTDKRLCDRADAAPG